MGEGLMAEFPALPLWTDAYLGDTTHLTTIEHGAYLLLLMTAWRTRDCALPDDDRLLARYARLNAHQWKRMRPILEPFFAISEGVWRQGRLTDERGAVERHRAQQSEKGKAGVAAKSLKRQERDKAGAKPGLPSGQAEVQPDASSLTLTHLQGSEDKESSAANLQTFDAETVMWRHGKLYLQSQGVSPDKAGSLLGKWKRAYEAEAVIVALGRAQREGAIEPVSFIEGALRANLKRSDYDDGKITV
jgi:uncharacterized protein YdaU (DUF1376 family)